MGTSRPFLMEMDLASSRVIIAGKSFPAVIVVCPRVEGDDGPDMELTLGFPANYSYWSGNAEVYVPAENGVLFEVEDLDRPGVGMRLSLRARSCFLYKPPNDDPLWLPIGLRVVDGEIVAGDERDPDGYVHPGTWHDCDPEWVVEMIDRWGHKPYVQPPGPEVRLVHLDHFREEIHAKEAR